MTIRSDAVAWLAKNHPSESGRPMRSSKFYGEQELWFLTFPSTFLDEEIPDYLLVLLQHESKGDSFHALKIPFDFLRANKTRFDVRRSGEKFDLHVSARKSKWMVDIRSRGIDFSNFSI